MEIKGLVETSFLDWPGKVCAVFFLGGCNFRCPYCHNHELVTNPQALPGRGVEEVVAQIRPLIGWLDGVVISGGEPTLSPGLSGLCRAIREAGFEVKLDTNGSRPRVLEALIAAGLIQAVSMDLKAPLSDPGLHRILSGVEADLEAIRASIDLLLTSGLAVEFRTTVVPGRLGPAELKAMAGQIKGARQWKLNAFRPLTCLDEAYTKIEPLNPDEMAGLQDLVSQWLVIE